MRVLIVGGLTSPNEAWAAPLRSIGHEIVQVEGQREAVAALTDHTFDVMVLYLVLPQGSAMAVADYANYRRPDVQVVAVTDDGCFSDGSIFAHLGNARALVPASTPPSDMGALIEHCAAA